MLLKRLRIAIIFSLTSWICYLPVCQAAVWNVGAQRIYTLPGAVRNLVNDGDTIYIDGGVYNNDAVKWIRKNLKFIGLGSGADPTVLRYTGDIANGKGIWVFEQPGICDNTYIENITFDGAQVSDGNGGNGAGIRYQALHLTVNRCRFINCQNGILEGGNYSGSHVNIENSEFANNGYNGSSSALFGYEHHIYISANTDSLLVRNCYFHDPRGEANSVKTRAQKSYILYNMINESGGNGSWELNIAQGGLLVVLGNVIIQGPAGANHGIVGWDAATNPIEELYFINNTVINKYAGNVRFVNVTPAAGITVFKFYNNIFASVPGASNSIYAGNVPAVLDTADNLSLADYSAYDFFDPAANDYRLLPSATSAIDNGTNAGFTLSGFSLTPASMFQSYTDSLLFRSISGNAIDIGAYEYATPANSGNEETAEIRLTVFPNPFDKTTTFEIKGAALIGELTLLIYNIQGQEVKRSSEKHSSIVEIKRGDLTAGIYIYKFNIGDKFIGQGKLAVE